MEKGENGGESEWKRVRMEVSEIEESENGEE